MLSDNSYRYAIVTRWLLVTGNTDVMPDEAAFLPTIEEQLVIEV